MAVPISKAAWAALTEHGDEDCEISALDIGPESDALCLVCRTHGDVLCEVIERSDDADWRATAVDIYGHEEGIEIHDNAVVSHSDPDGILEDGAYVQAWVWVDADDVEDKE